MIPEAESREGRPSGWISGLRSAGPNVSSSSRVQPNRVQAFSLASTNRSFLGSKTTMASGVASAIARYRDSLSRRRPARSADR